MVDATQDVRSPSAAYFVDERRGGVEVDPASPLESLELCQQWSVRARYCLFTRGAEAGDHLAKADSGTKRASDLRLHAVALQAEPLSSRRVVLERVQRGQEGNGEDIPYPEIYADDALGWRGAAGNVTLVGLDGDHAAAALRRFDGERARAVLRESPDRSLSLCRKPPPGPRKRRTHP
jgi:hypothetical protein